jgi:hypothetical protein
MTSYTCTFIDNGGEGSSIFRNVPKSLSFDTASYPRTIEPSAKHIWTDTLTANTEEMWAYNWWAPTTLAHAIPVSELSNRRHIKPFGIDTIHISKHRSNVTNKNHPATNVVLLTAAFFFYIVVFLLQDLTLHNCTART